MLKNKNIVVVGLQSWNIRIGSNCKNIAMELAKNNRVLYVNPPVDGFSRIRYRNEATMQKHLRQARTGERLVQLGPGIWNFYPPSMISSINWLPGTGLFNILNRRNNRRFARDIRWAVQTLGFSEFLLFNDSDMFRSFYLKEYLKPLLSIYYSRDNLQAVPYFYRHGRSLEPALMKKSTLVCANSVYLADMARRYNPKSFYVGQGCDLSVFDPDALKAEPGRADAREVAAELARLPRPLIGYIGAIISYRLDLPLLEELCRRQPGWSFVFVGKTDEAFSRSPLQDMENVHFLGLKPEKRLPAYLAQFDVAINPQSINQMTIGNYPRKIDEYLAMGKPVVATKTATMQSFKDFVHLASTVEEYSMLIAKALGEKDDAALAQQRMAFAREHTWENSVRAIGDAVLQVRPDMA